MFKKQPALQGAGEKKKELYLWLFIAAFVGMMICFLPSIISNKGIFLYYGDFNSQQMMFYKHAQQMVKEGSLGWDWGTDLGTDFVSSYSFYLLGSPFFWITTLFPVGFTVYLMPWLLSLKTAVAAVCAYAYIRRFVKSPQSAFIGAMLYAFSGFQTYNVFFNHFHDATAFFPLMLLGFELLVQENKKGPFAVAVSISACISYFFFVCEAIFMVIYFFLRCTDDSFDIDLKKFVLLIIEAIIGTACAGIILLPSVLEVLLNYRVAERVYGLDMVVYNDKTRIARIIQAFFMLSDMPARVNIFGADTARWASLAGYLPMFSMCGVIAYVKGKKKSWLTRSLVIFVIMAFVPILNATFVLFNASYYARWFYMPILLFCLMTSTVIDEQPNDLKKGFGLTAVTGLAFVGIGLLPTVKDDKLEYFKLPKYIELYWIQAAVTVLMILMLVILVFVITKLKIDFKPIACAMTVVACVICNTSSVLYGVAQGADNQDYIDRVINGKQNIDMDRLEAASPSYSETNNFYRIDSSESTDNWCMFWDLSSMRTFHSVVSTSIMDFYTEIDQTRDVASRMEKKLFPLRSLFSVKYYFNELPEKQRSGEEPLTTPQHCGELLGFEYVSTQNKFNIYENKNYLPMGFAFDHYTTDKDIKAASEVDKTRMLLKSLVLEPEQVRKYKDVIEYYSFSGMDFSDDEFYKNCADRRSMSCSSFKYDSYGFEAEIELDSPRLVFFSVPYNRGWSAKVNGKKADIEKVDYGFMAVLCPAGKSQISFSYEAYGSQYGKLMTAGGVIVLVVYIGAAAAIGKRRKETAEGDDDNGGDGEDNEASENENAESSAEAEEKADDKAVGEDTSQDNETTDDNAEKEQDEDVSE